MRFTVLRLAALSRFNALFALAAVVGGSLCARAADAHLWLPSIFGDHAVLQAGMPVRIWGRSAPGDHIKISFEQDSGTGSASLVAATADAQGGWVAHLSPMPVNTRGKLHIATTNGDSATVGDILYGEVWLAAGQSNMLYNTAGRPYAPVDQTEEVQVAENCLVAQREAAVTTPQIRVFQIALDLEPEPKADVRGKWVVASPDNVILVSAVAWNFGVALRRELSRPIGLVISAVGGTPVESWCPKAVVDHAEAGKTVWKRYNDGLAHYSAAQDEANTALWTAFRKRYPTQQLQDQNAQSRPPVIFRPHSGAAPAHIFNGMISGIAGFPISGAIWYQADGNEAHPLEYSELIRGMIGGWREAWQEEFPFLYVEMNNMRDDPQHLPVQFNNLSLIREQQQGALSLPKVGVVTAVDLGVKNPHFAKKKPVGERLAALALHEVYGRQNHPFSPQFNGFEIENNKIRVSLKYAEGLRLRSSMLAGFAIRGSAGAWQWASGAIEGQEIVLWNDAIPSPVAVRYAWASAPTISVENDSGLPLRPFRTDTGSPQ